MCIPFGQQQAGGQGGGISAAGQAGIGAGLFGTLFSAYSANEQGKFSDKISKINARNLSLQAKDAERRGVDEVEKVRERADQVAGQQAVDFAASGIDITSQTPIDFFAETARIEEEDVNTTLVNASREAHGFRTRAFDVRRQGRFDRRAGINRAGGTILSGLSNAALQAATLGAGG